MSEIATLGRLRKVDLREVWKTEAGDFTPWLAGEENIKLLGDTVGLDLEVEAQEKQVGPFRADILCKDTSNDNWVLVENQLERTDHVHLGQLMTYAAGLNAVTIVWIADRFTEEHRAALDWLNDITADSFNFFGLEVEIWKIGDSALAPKFNVVCKPNDWTRTIANAARDIQRAELTDTRLLQLEFWTAFRALIEQRGGLVRPKKPRPQMWMEFSLGRSSFNISTVINIRDKRIEVQLYIKGPDAKPHFHLLQEDQDAIEGEMGTPLEWLELPEKKDAKIVLKRHDYDPGEREKWPEQQEWIYAYLQRFHEVFSERVKGLDAGDYVSEDDDS